MRGELKFAECVADAPDAIEPGRARDMERRIVGRALQGLIDQADLFSVRAKARLQQRERYKSLRAIGIERERAFGGFHRALMQGRAQHVAVARVAGTHARWRARPKRAQNLARARHSAPGAFRPALPRCRSASAISGARGDRDRTRQDRCAGAGRSARVKVCFSALATSLAMSSCSSKASPMPRSNRALQSATPEAHSISCALTRT